MENFSQARKEKLLLLRKRKQAEETGDDLPTGSDLVKQHFRNYDPLTRQLKRFQGPQSLTDTVEKNVQGLQESIIAQDEQTRQHDLDLSNIAPKRANWDLKRDLEKRLKSLQRRDKEAVLLLIRQRIQSQQKDGLTAMGAEIAASTMTDYGKPSEQEEEDDQDDDEEEDNDQDE